jgi:hypothetical protein
MEVRLRYRGREVTDADVASIRALVADHPGASRRALSRELCAAWGWRQKNGEFRDMVCRGLMLALHRSGQIELPPIRRKNPNPFLVRRRPDPVSVDTTPIEGDLAALRPLVFRQVRRTEEEDLFDGLVEEHHYLGYTRPVGEHLKFLVKAADRPVACFAFSSAPRHLGPRDRFIGWSLQARKKNLHLIAYNPRFLVLPWVKAPHLASHLLGRMARTISAEWRRVYHHPIYFLETFVDPSRYRGTCYRAANWVVLGRTTGRGKDAPTWKPTRPVKEVLGLPLVRHFREVLGSVP